MAFCKSDIGDLHRDVPYYFIKIWQDVYRQRRSKICMIFLPQVGLELYFAVKLRNLCKHTSPLLIVKPTILTSALSFK